MYYLMRASAPSLHRESTDSDIMLQCPDRTGYWYQTDLLNISRQTTWQDCIG